MTDVGLALERSRTAVTGTSRQPIRRALTASALSAVVLGNVGVIVWLWIHGGNVSHLHGPGDVLTSVARITGLLAAYLALLQVLLLARIPALERLVGFDRLTVWHRWNGHACLDLVLVHVVTSIWGYALLDKTSSRSRSSAGSLRRRQTPMRPPRSRWAGSQVPAGRHDSAATKQ